MRVAVGLGSNLGDRQDLLRRAVAALRDTEGLRLLSLSSIYESAAVGPPQPDYLNAAVLLETELDPLALLGRLHAVEAALGRVRGTRWGPRTIDLDILWSDGPPLDLPGLVVPHPALSDRAFALAPLLELVPELRDRLDPALSALGGRPRRVAEQGWANLL